MAIDKIIPQYLNTDTDQKLVKSVEMVDNLNVRTSTDDEGSSGVLKNVKGTEALSPKTPADAFPAGDNRVIGSVSNEKSKEVIFFVWNSNSNHGIYRLETDIDKYVKVYEDSVLNFQKYSYVSCDVILNEDEETLVYFTDNVNPPMKINITRALSGGYPASFTVGTDEEKLSNLTTAKQPPLSPPSYSIVNNSSLEQNNIKDKVFQFAYKYVYTDGEHSALSPYSTLAVASTQYKDAFITESAKDFYNQINIFVKNSKADVKEIRVYAKEKNTGTFFEVDKVSNNSLGGVQTVNFSNSKLGVPLSIDEVNKVYDNVPQRAKSLSIANNRLMFGNYSEGYPNIETNVETAVNYENTPLVYNIPVTISTAVTVTAELDFSAIPSTIIEESKIYLNFTFSMKNLKISEMDAFANPDNTDISGYVTYKDLNDSTNVETEQFQLSVVKASTGIKGDLNDVLIKEIIDIPAGSTIAQVKQLVEDKIGLKKHYSMMTPIKGEDAYSILNTSGTTPFTTQSGRFEGRIEFEMSNSTSAGSSELYSLRPEKAELQLVDFFRNGSKKVDIVETSTIILNLKAPEFAARRGFVSLNKKIFNGGTFLNSDFDYGRSFKSGSSHKLGLLYFDDRNRASGVQELDSVYVKHFNNRVNENGLKGKSSIIARIAHNAPAWAKKWSLAYTGMGEKELKLFYSINGAFVPKFFPENSGLSAYNKTIYLSLNGLFNKAGSYTKVSGADIEYKFEKGDKLRIVNFDGNTTPYEFDVLDFKTLTEDVDSNPILSQITKNSTQATTGDFLIIKENPEATGLSSDAIIANTSNWFSNCVIEIYRSRKIPDEKIYYQIGNTYDITSGNHIGETRPSSLSFTIDNISIYNGDKLLYSTDKLFKGDVLVTGSGNVIVGNTWYHDGYYYSYFEDKNITPLSNGSYTATIDGNDAVVQINEGDVHFRPRALFAINNQITDEEFKEANTYNAIIDYVEDYSVSDFFSSKSSSIGKPFGYIPDAKTTRRKSSITYSDAFVLDSDRLPLSSFNLSLANWSDLDLMYGGIDAMVNRGDALTVLQESKASQIPISRNLIEYANGDAGVAVSKNVLGNASYYAGGFGTSGNPESVVERFGVIYYTDLNSRKVIRLSADGITPISEKGMSSYFQKLFENLEANTDTPKLIGGFDPDNNEYLLTIEDFFQSTIVVQSSDPELEPNVYNVDVDYDGNYTPTPTFTSTQILWNTIPMNWNTICDDWNNIGDGYLEIDGIFYIDSAYQGSTGTITILLTDTANSFGTVAQYNIGTGVVTIPSQTCDGRNITFNFILGESNGVTVSYKHKEGVWASKYSFQPSCYASIGNSLYSFYQNQNGLAWKHNINDTRNLFYGVQYDSMFEVVSNYNPSMVKTYEAMAVEGGGTWTGIVETSTQKTTISEFDEREGNRYAMIPRDKINSKSHQIYLGVVESVLGNNVTFTTPVNRLAFTIGEPLKVAVGSDLNTTGIVLQGLIDRKTILCSSAGINVGDNIFVEHNSLVDGDQIRDVYASIKLTSSNTEPFEVHALSVSYDRSRLHNDRVN
jgi:hypothetical protein